MMRKLSAALLGCALYGAALAAPTPSVFLLPTPENSPGVAYYAVYPDATGAPREAIMIDGIPVAFKYDNFWSYSGHILDSIQTVSPTLLPTGTYGTYDFSTGTGVIIANLSSVAGGATNDGGLQDPVNLSGGGDGVSGWVCEWGNDPQWCNIYDPAFSAARSYSDSAANQGTTTTVGELLDLLQSLNPEWTIPLLYADYNQTGGGDSLFMSAQVRIIDPGTGTVVASWYLDSLNNSTWNQQLPTYNFGDITFEGSALDCAAEGLWNPLTGEGCAGVTTSGSVYSGSHNKGSGKADFMAFAPDMDLSLFNRDYLWVATVNVGCNAEGVNSASTYWGTTTTQGCNTNGYEEFGIIGGVGGYRIPEPSSVALLGLGLAAAGFAGYRRRRA